MTTANAGLRVSGLSAGYGRQPVVRDLNLVVEPGQIVSLLGPNGAGKTTTLMTLAGVLKPLDGSVTWNGVPWRSSLAQRARNGLGLVTESRCVFMRLSVLENLKLGRAGPERAFELFPELVEHRDRTCGLLSGGQQQMLALARILAARPSVLLVDELSLGLAPMIVNRLLKSLRTVADEDGVAVLLVEQHANRALLVADYAYVLRRGSLALEGSAAQLRAEGSALASAYFSNEGIDGGTSQ